MWAAKNGNNQIVELLIENGANMDLQDFGGWTALMHAVYKGRTEVVHTLIDSGADVNVKNVGDHTALYIAEELNTSPDIIMALKEAGGVE